jgi:uncharacterized membrane protein YgcG
MKARYELIGWPGKPYTARTQHAALTIRSDSHTYRIMKLKRRRRNRISRKFFRLGTISHVVCCGSMKAFTRRILENRKENMMGNDPRSGGQGNHGQDNPEQGNPGQGNPGQGNPGQGKPGQGNPGQGNPGQGRPGQGNPGQGKPEDQGGGQDGGEGGQGGRPGGGQGNQGGGKSG